MITITKPTYKCEHCSKLYQRKHFAIKHELSCKKNPLNFRKCFNCEHCAFIEDSIFEDTWRGTEDETKVKTFFCNAKDHYLHPPKAEHKGNVYEFGDKSNEPMPMECDKFKNCNGWMEELDDIFPFEEKPLSEFQEKTRELEVSEYHNDQPED